LKQTKKYLVVIVGPTAIGKTALCVQLAKQFDTVVLSADSRQFFEELRIGTAKPTPEEMQGVPHFFVGHKRITDAYNIAQFEQDALAKLDELYQHQQLVLLTGGSGLYIQAVCEGMDDIPEVPTHIRDKWNHEYAEKGLSFLQQQLKQVDEVYYQQVDLNNPQRLIRALEVCEATLQPYSSFRTRKKAERPFELIKIGLMRDRDDLYNRIDQRMDVMLEAGLLEEARQFYTQRALNALQTVGYTELFDYFDGKYDWEECVRLLKRNSRRYAKRQLTWFRKDAEIQWFDPRSTKEITEFILTKIQ
jgi:tRNA dimethylallyltransferase